MTFPAHIALLNVFFAPFSFGGATIVAEQVARALQQRHGCRISAISAMNRSDLMPYAVMKTEADGFDSYLINLPQGRSYRQVYDNPAVTRAISDLVTGLAPDLVHAHCIQDIGAGVIPALKAQGVPVVLSMHDFWWICERQFMIRPDRTYCGQNPVDIEACKGCVQDHARARIRFDHLRAAAARADLITLPSRFAHDLAVNSGIHAAENGPGTAVWTNGVHPPGPGFFAAQAARRARDPRPVFGFVGGPSPIKGWPILKTAFETIGRDDFAGLLVDGSLDQSWWHPRMMTRLRGDWAVHPRFAQGDMDAFYAKIDVLLFLSQWKETFGLTVREAAARGITVLQTDAGGAADWDGADRAKMLAIGDGPDVLVRALNDVLDRHPDYPDPREMADFADQADAFIALVAPLVASGQTKTVSD